MSETIRRVEEREVEVRVPDGHTKCGSCGGKGRLSEYDRGVRSLVHNPRLAALEECRTCGGKGYVTKELAALLWGSDEEAGLTRG